MHTEHFHAPPDPFSHGRAAVFCMAIVAATLTLLAVGFKPSTQSQTYIPRPEPHAAIPDEATAVAEDSASPAAKVEKPSTTDTYQAPPFIVDMLAAMFPFILQNQRETTPKVETGTKPAALPEASVAALASRDMVDLAVYEQLERTQHPSAQPTLLEAIFGSTQPASSRAKVNIGYGRTFMDFSNTVGAKNGTRLQEPGCLYVKTSIHF